MVLVHCKALHNEHQPAPPNSPRRLVCTSPKTEHRGDIKDKSNKALDPLMDF